MKSAKKPVIIHAIALVLLFSVLALPFAAFSKLNDEATEGGIALMVASVLPALLIVPIAAAAALISGVMAILRTSGGKRAVLVVTTALTGLAALPLLFLI